MPKQTLNQTLTCERFVVGIKFSIKSLQVTIALNFWHEFISNGLKWSVTTFQPAINMRCVKGPLDFHNHHPLLTKASQVTLKERMKTTPLHHPVDISN